MLLRFILLSCFLSLTACNAASFSEKFNLVQLQINGNKVQVQLADTVAKRSQGLMGQTPLKYGMLLLLQQPAQMQLWMKNTPESLDVAFIDVNWRIVAITSMQANTETLHPSGQVVRAALEMAPGWFSKSGVQVGDSVVYCAAEPFAENLAEHSVESLAETDLCLSEKNRK
ncbi:DUF192 domain-containing protein [Rheinheimera sp.]|uniref:DUF192 domain-containing protein n=1 Tax=Rheinheimera sp. TaxID=1869214 RepID=UPI0027B8F9F4|nr:DUF192 domain-containing protein [Rheinheimera sp.]